MKKVLISLMCIIMVVCMMPGMAWADVSETIQTPHQYVVGDWTAFNDGNAAAVEGQDYYMVNPGQTNSDGYGVGPVSKVAPQSFENGTLVQEVNVQVDPAIVLDETTSFVQNGYLFVLSSALNNAAGNYTAESSYGLQKSGDVVKVDGTDITITEKGIYTFRIENKKIGENAYAKLTVLNKGVMIGETSPMKLTNTDGVPVSHRYLWFSNINVKAGLKVYPVLPAEPVTPPSGGGGGIYIPTTPADPLPAAKTEATNNVNNYVKPAEYEEAEAAEIKAIMDKAAADIKNAKTEEEVKAIEEAAKAEIDKIETAAEKAIIRTVEDTKFKARSKATTLNGKKAIKITWNVPEGMDFDGFEIYRSTEQYKGFGTEPIFTTTKQQYINNKGLEVGKTYYYKVRAFKYVNDEKVYTEYSYKAIRTVK